MSSGKLVYRQVAVIGVAESAFEFSAVVAGGLGELEGEGVADVVRAQGAESAVEVGVLGVVQAADLGDDGVDRAG
jgi:hypothetical protein